MLPNARLKHLIDDYLAWLRDRTQVQEIGDDWIEVSTPYVDRHNDFIQIYIKPENGAYLFSDDGTTLTELEQEGCAINTPKRQKILSDSLRSFGMTEEDGALVTRAREDDFVFRKHMFLQGLMAIGDMFYLSAPNVATLFLEDVEAWMRVKSIRAVKSIKLTGRSGFDHVFDFVIPASPSAPERVIKTFARPTRDAAKALAFSWVDTKSGRDPESKAFAVLNDSDATVPRLILEALFAYEITPVLWSERNDYVERLAA